MNILSPKREQRANRRCSFWFEQAICEHRESPCIGLSFSGDVLPECSTESSPGPPEPSPQQSTCGMPGSNPPLRQRQSPSSEDAGFGHHLHGISFALPGDGSLHVLRRASVTRRRERQARTCPGIAQVLYALADLHWEEGRAILNRAQLAGRARFSSCRCHATVPL